jgi:hypothetical protein
MRDIALLSDYIDSHSFPCSKDELICSAEDGCAPEVIINILEELPDVRFPDIDSVICRARMVEM